VAKYELGERRLDVIELLDVARAMGIGAISLIQRLDEDDAHGRRGKAR
jgi:hypothetical protein